MTESSTPLGTTSDPDSLAPLFAALRDPDWQTSQAATKALIAHQAAALPSLIAALTDPSGEVCRRAAQALGQIGDRQATAPLLAALHAPDPLLAWTAVAALGNLGDPQAVAPLIALFQQPDPLERIYSIVSVALAGIGPAAVDPLMQLLSAGLPATPQARLYAAYALSRLAGSAMISLFIQLLGDDSAEVRQVAADALGTLRAEIAVDALLDLLGDADADVRASTAQALGQIGDPRVLAALATLQTDMEATWEDDRVGDRATQAIAAIQARQPGGQDDQAIPN